LYSKHIYLFLSQLVQWSYFRSGSFRLCGIEKPSRKKWP
jgi:hypothetical protein